MRVLVVGAGEMGRWVADALDRGLADPPEVTFLDADPAAAEAAAADRDARVFASSANDGTTGPEASERFDAVCFAVPIPALEPAVAEHADRADSAVLDVTGVMEPAVDTLARAAPERERVSLHPLFAPENAPGNVAVVADRAGPVTDRIRGGFAAAGNDLFETTPAEHDAAMQTVQAKAHTAVLAFGLAAEDVREEFHTPVSAGLFDVLDRMTGNDAGVYGDIQTAFDGAGDVAAAARRIAEADGDEFARLYREAGRQGERSEREQRESPDEDP